MNQPLLFTGIHLRQELFDEYQVSNGDRLLDDLFQINIFVGKNNSGKSRLIRKLFSEDRIEFRAPILDIREIDTRITHFKEEFERVRNISRLNYFQEIALEIQQLPVFKFLKKNMPFDRIKNPVSKIARDIESYSTVTQPEKDCVNLVKEFQRYLKINLPQNEGSTVYEFQSIYIPTLRGLRPIHSGANSDEFRMDDDYRARTITDYFNGQKAFEDKIYTGLSLYQDVLKFSNGDVDQREKHQEFEKFLSETFFENETIDLIARHGTDVVYLSINRREHPIFNLGDGVQELIILTYPLFFNQDKNLKVFIEEPDLHLHPGFQRIFMNTLKRDRFKNFQFFISTHSNHLLDMTLDQEDISVFTLEEIKQERLGQKFFIRNVDNNDTNVLSLIGARNSSVFLSNCTIWVEGITDRIYLRKYLEIIQKDKDKQFQEDTHYSFVEYGGANITHWSFLESEDSNHPNIIVDRLCGKLFLITDRDSSGYTKSGKPPAKPSKKSQRFEQLQNKLGERFYCLEVREIENLLTPGVLRKTAIEYLPKSESEVDDKFRGILQKSYQDQYLGIFLDNMLSAFGSRFSSSAGSGTIEKKVDFAKKAVRFMDSKDDMSGEAYSLVDRIYHFIEEQNSII